MTLSKRRLLPPKAAEYRSGDRHYRAFVGSPDKYDVAAATQLSLLTYLGLREHHTLLDIGCGSLRAGKLFIPYLLPNRYCGIEPQKWLVEEGIANECGSDQISIKEPEFLYDSQFTCTAFDRQFDYLLAHSIFTHATEPQVRRCVEQAARCMHEESVFVATIVKGSSDYKGNDWVYPGVVTYTWEFVVEVAAEHHLGAIELAWPHPNQQTWVALARPDRLDSVFAPSDVSELRRLQGRLRFCEGRLERVVSHPVVSSLLRARRLLRHLVGEAGEQEAL